MKAEEFSAAGLPRAHWCQAAGALEEVVRQASKRGRLLQRIGLSLALEAIKQFRRRGA